MANGKSDWSKCRWHEFRSKHSIASSCDSDGERVLEQPIYEIVLIKEVEVWLPDEEIWCQDGFTTWGEPVVVVSKKERHYFWPNVGETYLCKFFVFKLEI